MSSKVWVAAARRVSVVLAAALVAAACGSGGSSDTVIGKASGGHLTIAIAEDQPGSSLKGLNGDYSGFDIDVAQFVAKELGVDPSGITWRSTVSADRETVLENGSADMVVETYSITDKRKKVISFAGPYFVAGQDLLVRLGDTSITGPESLNGKRLCSVAGTTSAQEVKDKFAQQTKLVEYAHFSECITALLARIVDAVTTDDLILAGYASQNPELLQVVGKTFTQERYGIGVRKGDTASVSKIDDAISKMISTGAWNSSLQHNFGGTGYKIPSPPQVTER
ncbi:glutamate ABC transporter substrate-binding protein [Kutzneria sp. 744]|uniref:glutamate ABC transporter substrate-binding protein n=1 Tax=Kutzneria sp. (strain 744) TaxID=345341 RepID=UPI0004B25D75|nr:glutamate ABC transporter substrate-binding protein [Kutzneria sp. 744]